MIHPSHILGEVSYAGLRMSADEFLALGRTGARYELIDGVVVMSPSPEFPHFKVIRFLRRQLERAADEMPGLEYSSELDVRFTDRIVYQPDLAVFRPGRVAPDTRVLALTPDLVIEVLSPHNRMMDLDQKRRDYERFGVPEYWVVDPDTVTAQVWRLEGGVYNEIAHPGQRIECLGVPGLAFDLQEVRRLLKRA